MDRAYGRASRPCQRKLSTINTRKAAGPDNIPGSVLKDCAEELKVVLTDILNPPLKQANVPSCFKAATIIPVPKKSSPFCFNYDCCPVALTPIIMKCFEGLVTSDIKSVLPSPWTLFSLHTEPNDPHGCNMLYIPPALPHLDMKDTCENAVHRLQFNTIISNNSSENWTNWASAPPSATDCWTSSHNQCLLETTPAASSP